MTSYAKLSKCEFCHDRLKFLGHIVSADGIAIYPDKISIVQRCSRPKSLQDHLCSCFAGVGIGLHSVCCSKMSLLRRDV
jgi:hypothetical protein